MADNPNPSRISAEMWQLWERVKGEIPGVRLGGIYANKPHYHSSVDENRKHWAGSYSIRLPLDVNGGNRDKARAIDLTMGEAEMRKRTKMLRDSALNTRDDRLYAVREFYGTLNGSLVYGLTKSSEHGSWSKSTSDNTHLWHVHVSVFTTFVDDWKALSGIESVLSGESLEEWESKEGDDLIGLKKGDKGTRVEALQALLRNAGFFTGTIDGVYGAATAKAVLVMRQSQGTSVTNGDSFTGWAYAQLMTSLAEVKAKEAASAGLQGPAGPQGPSGKTPTKFTIGTATVEATEWVNSP